MQKLILSSVIVSVFTVQAAFASPRDDAAFMAQQFLQNYTVEELRNAVNRGLIDVYGEYFAEMRARISDPDRFTSMLPESIMEHTLEIASQRAADPYLDTFTTDELAGIAAFFRSDLGQVMMHDSDRFTSEGATDNAYTVSDCGMSLFGEFQELHFSTPEQREAFLEFCESDAGQAWYDNYIALHIGTGFTILFAAIGVGRSDAHIEEHPEFILEVMEADGVLSFPNPIWRRDMIEQVRSEFDLPSEGRFPRFD